MPSSFDFAMDVMLKQGDFDLSSVQMYAESLKEALKKTMLSQDVIFRKQVEELHRLYLKQKTLMENLAWREFDRYNLRKASAHSKSFPFANSARYEPLAKETLFSSIQMAGPTLSTDHMLEGHQGMPYNLWQGPRDLQLSCDHDPELKLSLSSGYDNWREGSAKKTWLDKKAHSCARIIIDLEESIERVSNEGEKDAPSFRYTTPTPHSGSKHQPGFSVLSDAVISSGVKKDLQDGTADSHTLLDDLKCHQEQVNLNKEFKDCNSNIPTGNQSTKMQQLTFCKAHLDLNKVQLDESSCCSNDIMLAHPSTANSAQVFIELVGRVQEDNCASITRGKENKRCSNDISDLPHQDDAVNSSLVESNSRSNITEIQARSFKVDGVGGSEVGLLGVEAVSGPPPGLCEDLGGHSSYPKDGSNGFVLELKNDLLHDPNCTAIATRQINFEQSKVDVMLSGSGQSQNTVQDGCGDEYHASCKSHSNGDNDSSSVKTMQSRIEMGSSNLGPFDQFPGTHLGCQVPETSSGNQDREFSDSSDLKHECFDHKEESSEADALIHRAAESLVHFSLEMTSANHDCSAEAGLTETKSEEREQPLCSSDSFELIALNLKECSADEYSVSSKPFEVNDMETKDSAFKLKRGRRMKDFQKDILPGLACLSRHEIREDINILEGVLRSREYRKIRARMANGQNWCAPVRNRRSRINCVKRKKF
ncbi:uncharacterized protein LOC122289917 [Carya illinoinensis]|uniref:uncharacterized protein LOC122289917 n=1 Tax=Carya illinoinensis TaxID=32201 RepID=UPI001C7284E0|nr:uncharacterized protein LOC122289917 [Carya illinoinensis]